MHPCLFDPMPLQDTLRQSVSFLYLENHSLGEWFIGRLLSIIEAEVCPDHIHMLVEIPPKYSVSSFMGYLKGKSSLMIYEKYPELKYKYRN